ncbi:glycosyltransferase [Gracilibacillus marinus]|uniref:Glycosyltransferase n=1 Tax=Gracilibacillus marinus TaxID=630535 RepID=A0ABV8VPZ7_9BACI
MKPLVSIIIPVYNVEDYLEECLNSILNQTYPNLEVLMINDGSTDNSKLILEKYNKEYDNFYMFSQSNKGQAVCRNIGIDNSKGKYLYFLDSDDYILPDTIENLIATMERDALDLIRFSAQPFSADKNYNIVKNQYNFERYFDSNRVYNKNEFLEKNLVAYSTSPCLYIVKKEIIIQKNIRFVSGILYEDELFTLEVFLNVSSVKYDPKDYYKRRYRENSVMTTYKDTASIKSFDSYLTVLKQMERLFEKYQSVSEQRLIIKRIEKIFSILSNIHVDKKYKREKLKEIYVITGFTKIKLTIYYKIRKILKRIYFFIKKVL